MTIDIRKIIKSRVFVTVISAIVYFCVVAGGSVLLFAGLNLFFVLHGVNEANIHTAPDWCIWLSDNYPLLISCVTSLIVCGLLIKPCRGLLKSKKTVLCAAAGILTVVIPECLFLLCDSNRIVHPTVFEISKIWQLIPLFSAAAAEQLFFRSFICSKIWKNGVWGWMISTALLLVFSFKADIVYMINIALINFFLLFVSMKFGGISAIIAKSAYSMAILLMPQTYPVSERILTGGANGYQSSLALTVIMLIIAVFIFIRSKRNADA